jgi:hypothetical protein
MDKSPLSATNIPMIENEIFYISLVYSETTQIPPWPKSAVEKQIRTGSSSGARESFIALM